MKPDVGDGTGPLSTRTESLVRRLLARGTWVAPRFGGVVWITNSLGSSMPCIIASEWVWSTPEISSIGRLFQSQGGGDLTLYSERISVARMTWRRRGVNPGHPAENLHIQ